MSSLARRLVPFALMLGLSACMPPPLDRGPQPLTMAPPAPPPVAARVLPVGSTTAKSVGRLRPRLMGGALITEALSPAMAIQSLDDGLYGPQPSPALRSAGLRQLSAQHIGAGNAEAAVSAARGAHALAVEAYGPDHVESVNALILLSDALTAAGRTTEAETVLLVVSTQVDGLFGPNHPSKAAATQRLAIHRGLAPLGPLLRSFNRRANRQS